MKDIRDCAELYSTLLYKDYIFTLEGDICFKLFFKDRNFAHLLGLGKLFDVEQLQAQVPEKTYKDILVGNITQRMLFNSNFYNRIENRMVTTLCC